LIDDRRGSVSRDHRIDHVTTAKTIDVEFKNKHYLWLQEGQHPLTGQRAANFRLMANQ